MITEAERAQSDDEPPFPNSARPIVEKFTEDGHEPYGRIGRMAGHVLMLAAVVAVVFAYLGRTGSATGERDTFEPDWIRSRQTNTIGEASESEPAQPQGPLALPVVPSSTAPNNEESGRSTSSEQPADPTSGSFDLSTATTLSPGATADPITTDLGRGPTTATAQTRSASSTSRSTSTTGQPGGTSSQSTVIRTSTTRSTSSASTTLQPPPPPIPTEVDWALGSAGTISSAVLPLDSPLGSGALANYDVDRDGAPGLLLQKGGGPGETDSVKVQRWWLDLPAGAHLDGRPVLRHWAAVKDFDQAKTGGLEARLYDCATARSDCRLLASGRASVRQASFGAGFGAVAITLGSVDRQVAAGRGVVLELTVPSSSDDDMWLAFGTQTYDSRLTID